MKHLSAHQEIRQVAENLKINISLSEGLEKQYQEMALAVCEKCIAALETMEKKQLKLL